MSSQNPKDQSLLEGERSSTSPLRKLTELSESLHGLDEVKTEGRQHVPRGKRQADSFQKLEDPEPMKRIRWLEKLKSRAKIWIPFVVAHFFILPTELLSDSDLRLALIGSHTPLYYVAYFLLVVTAFTLYWIIFFSDPGYIKRPVDDGYKELNRLGSQGASIEMQPPSGMLTGLEEIDKNYCFICDISKPPRSKHCYFCHRCVGKFDHHCPFLGICIGGRNHRTFWWFLCFESIILLWTLVIELEAIAIEKSLGIGNVGLFVYQIFGTIVTIAFVIYCVPLFLLHTYNACSNVTTYELILKYRARKHGESGQPISKYNQGLKFNLRQFCGARMREEWIYPEPRHQF